jgi:hypothetical protein
VVKADVYVCTNDAISIVESSGNPIHRNIDKGQGEITFLSVAEVLGLYNIPDYTNCKANFDILKNPGLVTIQNTDEEYTRFVMATRTTEEVKL